MDTLPRTRASQEPDGYHRPQMISRRKRTRGLRCSSGLQFQVLAVETRSFLPDDQSDRRDLARQGQTSHRRLHPLGQQTFVKLAQRSRGAAGPHGRALEDPFEIVVVVLIQTP